MNGYINESINDQIIKINNFDRKVLNYHTYIQKNEREKEIMK